MTSLAMTPLEEAIGYRFREPRWLRDALTHPSCALPYNNQRLEFLGDAVLGMVAAHLLHRLYPKADEGELARRHAGLVCGPALSQIALELGLGGHLQMAGSEQAAGGRGNPTNLEDACEALIGALFLDGGLEAAEAFILPRWQPLAHAMDEAPKDAKTALQEWAQARGLALPSYQVVESAGPAHAPLFTIEVSVQGVASVRAEGRSKRAAEQAAATLMVQRLQ